MSSAHLCPGSTVLYHLFVGKVKDGNTMIIPMAFEWKWHLNWVKIATDISFVQAMARCLLNAKLSSKAMPTYWHLDCKKQIQYNLNASIWVQENGFENVIKMSTIFRPQLSWWWKLISLQRVIRWDSVTYFTASINMMTSSNGNMFRVTGPLCGEFISHRWIPSIKASDAELWCFLWSSPE